jgi:hypothetical protein
MKEVPVTGKAFSPQKQATKTSKHDIYSPITGTIFVGPFARHAWIRIQMNKTNADPSGSTNCITHDGPCTVKKAKFE